MDETIQQKLEQVNTRTIETNPLNRLRQTIERLNRNLDKCGVTVDGCDLDSKRSKVMIPECLRPKTYESLGHYGGRVGKLQLEVILQWTRRGRNA
jgi:hypothetical protein